ncbi:cytochrome P450 52A13 (DH-ALK2), partial [Scheffersomyces amazonensis]|uniref:cytochrome P450 52A13 (DH-ALK2) n=1 Tax=Scheffersomyces amazonensis TaxID=1078765 RepID=UPI00315DBCDC
MAISSAIETVVPYLTKWYSILVGAILVYFVTNYIKQEIFKRKHGCVEGPILQDTGIFCIPLLLKLLKVKREGGLGEMTYHFFSIMPQSFVIRLIGVRIIMTCDPENIKAVLATQFNDFALGNRHEHFKPVLGDGIFTLDGEGWKHSRAMLRPQFARDQVAHVQALEPHMQVFFKHVQNNKGKTFDLQKLFFEFTVDTASEFLFGESVHSLYDESVGLKTPNHIDGLAEFPHAFNTVQHYLASRSWSQFMYWVINPSEFRKVTKIVHKVAKYYVDRALSLTPEELEEKSKSGYVFLYELAKHTRDRKVLQDQLLNILVAGRDTTAGLLSFTFYELARNPDVFEKLKAEINETFGSGSNVDLSLITFESLKKCEYLKCVLNEVLRLYPSVPINFRVATRDTVLPRGGGQDNNSPLFVGKGSTVAYSAYVTHRLEEYYGKDSLVFRPERWLESQKLGWAYVPFNGGPRICLGQQFALTEASYVVTRLIQQFPNLVSKDSGPYPPRKMMHLTMCHNEGVFVQM